MTGFEHILAALHEAALDTARWPRASGLIDKDPRYARQYPGVR